MNNQMIMRSLPMVASVLGRKYGVKVEIGGKQAYTDGHTIHLPSLPLEEHKDLTTLVRAWLDHESAHIRFTDFEFTKSANLTPLEMHITNILEDWRVENELVKRYPGCRSNLNYMIRHHFSSLPPMQNDPVALIGNYILLAVRSWDVNEVGPIRDQVGDLIEQSLPQLFHGINTVLNDVFHSCSSTANCIEYAKRIVALIQVEANNQKKQENNKNEYRNQSQAQRESSQDTSKCTTQGDSIESLSEAPQGGSTSNINNTVSSTESYEKTLESLLNATAIELQDDMSQSVASQLESTSTETGGGALAVATEADKDIQPLSSDEIVTVKRTSVALHARLHSLLQTTTLSRRQPGRRGRLDTSRLYKAAHDPKVFLNRSEKQGIDTAVHILLDCSGSMRNRMILAGQSCFAIADSLNRIDGVSVGVTAFPAGLNQRAGNRITVKSLLEHGEKIHGNFKMNATGNTPMGEALWHVMQKMIPLKENRKIILIVTDGQPSNLMNAEKAIEQGSQFGFEFYGIGIVDRYIEKLLPASHCVIKDMTDLAPAMFKLLQDALAS